MGFEPIPFTFKVLLYQLSYARKLRGEESNFRLFRYEWNRIFAVRAIAYGT